MVCKSWDTSFLRFIAPLGRVGFRKVFFQPGDHHGVRRCWLTCREIGPFVWVVRTQERGLFGDGNFSESETDPHIESLAIVPELRQDAWQSVVKLMTLGAFRTSSFVTNVEPS